MESSFKQTLAIIKQSCKYGDLKQLAIEAGCTTQTLRSMFKRNSAMEFTKKERLAFEIASAHLKDTITGARQAESAARRLTKDIK